MPSIDFNFLLKLKDDFRNFDIFVETGTYMGQTIRNMEPLFSELYTIEVSENLYNNLNKNSKKINFILGDSSIIFESLLNNLHRDTIFFLDGHWSSGETGKGVKDCPLIEEINLINEKFKHRAILIIDDYRMFGTKINEDWSEISKDAILNILKDRYSIVYHLESEMCKDDRLIIHLN